MFAAFASLVVFLVAKPEGDEIPFERMVEPSCRIPPSAPTSSVTVLKWEAR